MDTQYGNTWILWLIACSLYHCVTVQAADKRCKNVISVPYSDACGLFRSFYGDGNHATDGIPCSDNSLDEEQCLDQGCCVHKGKCYKKPVTCYADFRIERCPLRQGWRQSSIYTGFSINGSDCFIESIQSYLEFPPDRFWHATSIYGVRILGQNNHESSCVAWINTTVTTNPEAPRQCTVFATKLDNTVDKQSGTMRANKCVLSSGPFYISFEIGSHKTCACHLDAWAESESESTHISTAIRRYAETEEKKSSCSRILGRLVRNSWRNRVEIVNSAEAEIVVGALLNITNNQGTTIDTKDAEVLLDTSEQLSKYKFYEGLENDSANLLIQSSTKFLSKIMKSVTSLKPSTGPKISKRSAQEQGDEEKPGDLTTYERDLQWKIMDNLEDIAENIASLINLPDGEPKYVVEAEEETVSLHVSIATPKNVQYLSNTTKLEEPKYSIMHGASAQVTNFSSYKGDDNIAIITAFYDIPQKDVKDSWRRASGILAINPRTMKNEIVTGNFSLPVKFTLPASNNSCNGTSCKPTCNFAQRGDMDLGERWNDSGCRVVESDENFTTCACDHTTHFAVLMLPTSDRVISEKDLQILELLSLILGSLSIAAMASTLVVFFIFRRILLKDRMLIHLHLIIALMGGYISIMCGAVFSSRYLGIPEACLGFTVGSHLFFLASFFWFLMEGVYLFYKVVLVFSNKWAEGGTKFSPIVAWGSPVLIVGASLVASRIWDENVPLENYFDPERCFLQTNNGMIWSFMAPAVAIIVVNALVLGKVVTVIFQSSLSRNSKTVQHGKVSDSLKNSVKGAVLLMPILGIPWILNLFAVLGGSAGTAMAYVHVIIMGLQGICIFLFYCLFNSDVRAAYKLSAERRRSLASLEPPTKNRKRSQAPLLASNKSSPESIRYKNSLTVSTTGRTLTGSSQHSASSAPPSPGSRQSTLPPLKEHQF